MGAEGWGEGRFRAMNSSRTGTQALLEGPRTDMSTWDCVRELWVLQCRAGGSFTGGFEHIFEDFCIADTCTGRLAEAQVSQRGLWLTFFLWLRDRAVPQSRAGSSGSTLLRKAGGLSLPQPPPRRAGSCQVWFLCKVRRRQ